MLAASLHPKRVSFQSPIVQPRPSEFVAVVVAKEDERAEDLNVAQLLPAVLGLPRMLGVGLFGLQ